MINVHHHRPWKRAAIWLLLLGPFFFISYGFANWLASQQTHVDHIAFNWEQHIPFLPWTIIPYWSIDLLYGISLFICTTKVELDSHAKRLLSAQCIAVICFILFPLTFSFTRPETQGLSGNLFTALSSFDQPFNQAPSLHITLLMILWVIYPPHLSPALRWPFHGLCLAIGVSVLTTYQHHFIDIPTGMLLGFFCIWLWPDDGSCTLKPTKLLYPKTRWRIASYYLLGSIFFTLLAFAFGNTALWLLWPAISLLFVALFYLLIGNRGFQKNSRGEMSIAAKWLLLPYLLGAKMNAYFWTLKDHSFIHIDGNVWLGKFPNLYTLHSQKFYTVIDLTAEFSAPVKLPANTHWHALPTLDLITPPEESLLAAAKLIIQHQENGPILVNCALGYSRSALVIITWLLLSHREKALDSAIAKVRNKRPAIVLKDNDTKILKKINNDK